MHIALHKLNCRRIKSLQCRKQILLLLRYSTHSETIEQFKHNKKRQNTTTHVGTASSSFPALSWLLVLLLLTSSGITQHQIYFNPIAMRLVIARGPSTTVCLLPNPKAGPSQTSVSSSRVCNGRGRQKPIGRPTDRAGLVVARLSLEPRLLGVRDHYTL